MRAEAPQNLFTDIVLTETTEILQESDVPLFKIAQAQIAASLPHF